MTRPCTQRPPRDPKKLLLTFPLLMRTGLVALISLAGAFGLFAWEHGTEGRNLDEARAAVVNVIVMVQTVYLLNCRSRTRSALPAGVFSNCWMLAGIVATWLAQLLFTYLPFMNRLFHSAPVRAEAWLYIVAIGVFTFAVVEFEKWLRFRANPPGAALTHMTEVAVYDANGKRFCRPVLGPDAYCTTIDVADTACGYPPCGRLTHRTKTEVNWPILVVS